MRHVHVDVIRCSAHPIPLDMLKERSHVFEPDTDSTDPFKLEAVIPMTIEGLQADLARSWPPGLPIDRIDGQLPRQLCDPAYEYGVICYIDSFRKPDMPPMHEPPVWNQELEVLYQSVTPSTVYHQLYEDQQKDDLSLHRHFVNCTWTEAFSHRWVTAECACFKEWHSRAVTRYNRGLGTLMSIAISLSQAQLLVCRALSRSPALLRVAQR